MLCHHTDIFPAKIEFKVNIEIETEREYQLSMSVVNSLSEQEPLRLVNLTATFCSDIEEEKKNSH